MRLLAIVVFALSIWRARTMSITIDEAYTYNTYVAAGFDGVFFFGYDANNHVLHTALVWLCTKALGVQEWTVRLPALLGSAAYLWLLILLLERTVSCSAMRRLSYAVLVLNPMTLDLLCVARGYSLALALLAGALLCLFRYTQSSAESDLKLLGLCLGLACAANLSFAFVSLAVLLLALPLIARHKARFHHLRAMAVPCITAFLWLMIYPLSHADRNSLYWGAPTIRISAETTTDALILHEPGNFEPFASVKMRNRFVRRFLPLGFFLILGATVLSLLRGDIQKPLTQLSAVLLLTLSGYWLAHVWLGVLYPRERTAIALVFLFFTTLAGWTSEWLESKTGHKWLAWAAAPVVLIYAGLLIQFAWQQRDLSYTWAWHEDRDHRHIADLLRRRGAKSISAFWLFQPSLEFYRLAGRMPQATPLVRHNGAQPLRDHDAYVLLKPGPESLDSNGLVAIWSNPATGVVVAIPRGEKIAP